MALFCKYENAVWTESIPWGGGGEGHFIRPKQKLIRSEWIQLKVKIGVFTDRAPRIRDASTPVNIGSVFAVFMKANPAQKLKCFHWGSGRTLWHPQSFDSLANKVLYKLRSVSARIRKHIRPNDSYAIFCHYIDWADWTLHKKLWTSMKACMCAHLCLYYIIIIEHGMNLSFTKAFTRKSVVKPNSSRLNGMVSFDNQANTHTAVSDCRKRSHRFIWPLCDLRATFITNKRFYWLSLTMSFCSVCYCCRPVGPLSLCLGEHMHLLATGPKNMKTKTHLHWINNKCHDMQETINRKGFHGIACDCIQNGQAKLSQHMDSSIV